MTSETVTFRVLLDLWTCSLEALTHHLFGDRRSSSSPVSRVLPASLYYQLRAAMFQLRTHWGRTVHKLVSINGWKTREQKALQENLEEQNMNCHHSFKEL
ncbi:hypothetical protein EYF80_014318 [Liparis tanakae]|uniref:Uncharacterized protein n=1 Tax=Liparis tanakae TaxID=230148 RepID=A0A4Z2IBY4_9TELE|nr:hypothetical protein EYF80_014318 [Liparis tanakae]